MNPGSPCEKYNDFCSSEAETISPQKLLRRSPLSLSLVSLPCFLPKIDFRTSSLLLPSGLYTVDFNTELIQMVNKTIEADKSKKAISDMFLFVFC